MSREPEPRLRENPLEDGGRWLAVELAVGALVGEPALPVALLLLLVALADGGISKGLNCLLALRPLAGRTATTRASSFTITAPLASRSKLRSSPPPPPLPLPLFGLGLCLK